MAVAMTLSDLERRDSMEYFFFQADLLNNAGTV